MHENTNAPFRARTLLVGFMSAESAVMGRRRGWLGIDISMMTTLFWGEVSRTQMYLSDSIVTCVNVTNCWFMPKLVSCIATLERAQRNPRPPLPNPNCPPPNTSPTKKKHRPPRLPDSTWLHLRTSKIQTPNPNLSLLQTPISLPTPITPPTNRSSDLTRHPQKTQKTSGKNLQKTTPLKNRQQGKSP